MSREKLTLMRDTPCFLTCINLHSNSRKLKLITGVQPAAQGAAKSVES